MDKNNTDIEEFFEQLWSSYVSDTIVSDAYMAIHEDFVWELTFNMYELWRKDENLTVKVVARMMEGFFRSLFNYVPPQGISFTEDLRENFFEK